MSEEITPEEGPALRKFSDGSVEVVPDRPRTKPELLKEAALAGFSTLYLTTDHDGYYEKYGWTRIEDGYDRDGEPCRIYCNRIS